MIRPTIYYHYSKDGDSGIAEASKECIKECIDNQEEDTLVYRKEDIDPLLEELEQYRKLTKE